MKRTWILCGLVVLTVAACQQVVYSADLFGIEVTYSGGTITQSASSLPDLVEAVVGNQGAFAPLVGEDFTGSLTYYGIPDAVTVKVVGETQLTITSSLTGLDRTFTGTGREDLQEQLIDWLLKEGGDEVARLIQEASKRSAAAITDGNPSSATAWGSDRAFGTFAMYPATRPMRGSTKGGYLGIWADARQAEADTATGTIDRTEYGLNVPWWLHLSRRLSLIGNISGRYADVEGTDIVGGGLDLGLGIRLAVRDEQATFGWQVTPFAGLYGVGTYEGATAGLLDQFGLANRLEFRVSDNVLVVVANQFSYFISTKIKIEDVEIDPQVEQQVLKNGVMVDMPVPSVRSLYVNGFVVDTRFLKDAAIDSYQTVGGGLAIRGSRGSLEVYISHDFAGDYSAWNACAGLGLGL